MAVIQFDNGQKVEFDGTPTSADVEEVARNLGIGAPAATPAPKTTLQKIQSIPEATTSIFRGAAKGVASSLGGAGSVVEKGAQAFSRAIGAPVLSEVVGAGNKTVGESIQEKVKANGIGEKIGFAGEQIAEFMAPLPGKKIEALAEGASLLSRAARAFKVGAVSAIDAGARTAIQTGGDVGQSALVGGMSLAVPLASLAFKTPLTMAAEKLYASAAKFNNSATDRAASKGIDLVKTALKERVFLTEGGVERVAAKIDDMENELGKAIAKSARAGTKISMNGLGAYIDEAKNLFKHDFNVSAGDAVVKELDAMKSSFLKKYGKYVPIEDAQKIKVATGQRLAKYYGKLTSMADIEGAKAGTRFLKDKIVEAAPIVGDINNRLKSLYELDKALDGATKRIKKLNLLGLGTKILLAGGTKETTAAAGALQLLGNAFSKSSIAISMNEIAKLAEQASAKGQLPLTALFDALLDAIRPKEGQE